MLLRVEPTLLCALVGIRTPNLLIRSEMLYPVELQMHFPVFLGTAKIGFFIVMAKNFMDILFCILGLAFV
jgi:hypothetical protein